MLAWYIFCHPSVFNLFILCLKWVSCKKHICSCWVAKSCPTFVTPWIAAWCQAPLPSIISQSLFKFMSIESVMLSNHLILCHPLFLLPSIFPSIRVFSDESALCIRWPKYWCFSLNISPFNEYSGLISFRIDCFGFFAVQGTLKNLLQHNLKASVLWRSAFFMVHLSHPYMTTGKTVALTYSYLCEQSKWCVCFLICCLGLPELSFQGARIF